MVHAQLGTVEHRRGFAAVVAAIKVTLRPFSSFVGVNERHRDTPGRDDADPQPDEGAE